VPSPRSHSEIISRDRPVFRVLQRRQQIPGPMALESFAFLLVGSFEARFGRPGPSCRLNGLPLPGALSPGKELVEKVLEFRARETSMPAWRKL